MAYTVEIQVGISMSMDHYLEEFQPLKKKQNDINIFPKIYIIIELTQLGYEAWRLRNQDLSFLLVTSIANEESW